MKGWKVRRSDELNVRFPPIADISGKRFRMRRLNVRFRPNADIQVFSLGHAVRPNEDGDTMDAVFVSGAVFRFG
jgi:hypothetical protein